MKGAELSRIAIHLGKGEVGFTRAERAVQIVERGKKIALRIVDELDEDFTPLLPLPPAMISCFSS